jgi:hypothetical protein
MEPVKVEDLNIALGVVAAAVLQIFQQLTESDLGHLAAQMGEKLDGLPSQEHYCRDCEVCEGMDW